MAKNEIGIVINIDGKSIPITQKQAAALKKELDGVTTSAKNADKAVDSIGGSKAAGKAFKSTTPSIQENIDYRNARGVAGTGGGGSRDFAKQAQGLGGLVHLYATFAANIFAVSAAYTALEKAFSTTRLMKSAEVMGATLGVNLKGLAHDLQIATNYALSFQDALKFSSMGTSAGLTAKQIQNLTVIAKGAANALGRDMNDAIDRIIRGTAKMEQEILDELGIFVRANTAYKEYAKTLGLSGAEALTSAQKVKAYAAAVEQAGEKWKKFAEIEDPFSKFTAKLKEAGTDLLNIVNIVFTPIFNALGESDTLIRGLLIAGAAYLTNIAIPAIQQFANLSNKLPKYREELQKLKDAYKIRQEESIALLQSKKLDQSKIFADEMKQALNASAISNLVSAKAKENLLNKIIGSPKDIEKHLKSSLQGAITAAGNTFAKAYTEKDMAKLQEANTKVNALINLQRNLNELVLKEALGREQVATILQEIEAIETDIAAKQEAIAAGQLAPGTNKQQRKIGRASATAQLVEGVANSGIGSLFKKDGIWKDATVGMGKLDKALVGLSTGFRVAGLAVSFLLEPLMLVMGAMAIWDIALAPILTKLGFLTDHDNKVATSLTKVNEVAELNSEAFRVNAEAIAYNGDELDKIINKHNLLLNTSENVVAALGDMTNALSEFDKKAGSLNKLWDFIKAGVGASAGQNARDSLLSIIEEEKKKAELSGNTGQWTKLDMQRVNLNRLGFNPSREQIQVIAKSVQDLSQANAKFSDITKNAIETSSKAIKNIDDIKKLMEDSKIGLDSQEAKNFLSSIESITKVPLTGGNFNEISAGLGQLDISVSSLADNLQNKAPQAAQALLLLHNAIRFIKEDVIDNQAFRGLDITKQQTILSGTIQNLGIDKLAKDAATGMDKYIGDLKNPKNTTEKIDQTMSIKKELLDIDKKSVDIEKNRLNFESSRFEKAHGYLSEELIQKRAALELVELDISYQKELLDLQIKEAQLSKDKKSGAISESDFKKYKDIINKAREQASSSYSFGKSQVLDKATSDQGLEIDKKQKQQAEHEKTIYDLKTKNLDISKELGYITEEEYISLKAKQDINILDLQYKNDIIGKSKEEQDRLKEILAISKQNVTAEELKTQELIKRAKIEKNYQNSLEEINQLIEEANKSFSSRVKALNLVSSKEQVITKTYMTRMVLTKDELEKQRLKLELQRELVALYNEELDAREKAFFDLDAGNQLQTIFDEAQRQYSEFYENVTNVVKGTFDSVYAGMDAAIDELADKIMRSESISLSSLWTTFRNTAAEMFRNLAADYMKLGARDLIKDTIGKVFEVDLRSPEQKAADKAAEILKQSRDIQLEQTDLLRVIAEAANPTATGAIPKAKDKIEKKPEDIVSDIKGTIMSKAKEVFMGVWENLKGTILGIFGKNGIVQTAFLSLGTWITKLLGSIGGESGGSDFFGGLLGGIFGGSSSGGSSGGFFDFLSGITSTDNFLNPSITGSGLIPGFAKGGVMSEYGPLQVNRYASGGIAHSPQMAIYGEGRQSEAYVPLPDNRSIPVTLNGGNGGNTTISITINDNTESSSSSSDTAGKDKEAAHKEFAKIISNKVREELVQQKRPGGLLFNGS